MDPTAIRVALRVAAAVEAVGGGYFVGGSLASSMQGEPRATNDIDIVLDLPLGRVREFVDLLGTDFEVDLDMLRQALRTGTSCNVFYLPLLTKVDLFAVGPSAYDEVEFSRRTRVVLPSSGAELFVKTPEDTVLRKLWWYREGGGVADRQWRDVVSVLTFSGAALDRGYMDRWAQDLGVTALLERAVNEAGL